MKKVILSIIFLAIVPLTAFAQERAGSEQALLQDDVRPGMMRGGVYGSAVPYDIRLEYDVLMTKMANGTLTQEESRRLEEVAQEREEALGMFDEDQTGKYGYDPVYDQRMVGYGMHERRGVSSYYRGHMMRDIGSFGQLGIVMPLLFWTLVIVGITLIVRLFRLPRRQDTALTILRERYTKGEIEKKEFEEKKKDLL